MKNLGPIERIVRAVLGFGLLGLYGALDSPVKYLTLLGLIPLATALTGRCPVYRAFRLRGGGPEIGSSESPKS